VSVGGEREKHHPSPLLGVDLSPGDEREGQRLSDRLWYKQLDDEGNRAAELEARVEQLTQELVKRDEDHDITEAHNRDRAERAESEVGKLREYVTCADWYIKCLLARADRKIVRGLDEAETGYDNARAALAEKEQIE
jgi:hypothetical protein